MTHAARATARRDGFSLIEVMIATLVLAFGLLVLALMQVQALQQGSSGRYTTEATAIVADQLRQIQRMPWATATAASGAGWQAPAWINAAGFPAGDIPVRVDQAGGGTAVSQVYSIAWRVTPVAGNANLLNIDVEASWTDPNIPNGRPTRTGQPSVTLSSVKYNW